MTTLYEQDFYSWTQEQAAALRRAAALRPNNVPGVDWENVAEEIATLGATQLRELVSRYKVLLLHLLKWRYQPSRRTPGWRRTIRDQRDELEELFRLNPSLAASRADELDRAYKKARRGAAEETGLSVKTFPLVCPFTLEEIEDPDYLPEPEEPAA